MMGMFVGVYFGVLILLSLLLMMGWAVWRIFGLWVEDKVISFMEMLVIIVVMFGLMAMALALPGVVGVGALIFLFCLLLSIPFLPRVAGAIKLRQLIRNDIAGFQAALARNPEVPYPHRKLGDIFYEHENWERAIDHYRAYVNSVEAKPDVRHRLERALTKRRQRDMGLRVCPACGMENMSRNIRCEQCGFYLHGPREFVDALTGPEMMVRWKWLIGAFFVPGVVLGLLGEWVPPVVSLVLLGASVIATVIFLYGRAREERAKIIQEAMSPHERVIAGIPERPEARRLEETAGYDSNASRKSNDSDESDGARTTTAGWGAAPHGQRGAAVPLSDDNDH